MKSEISIRMLIDSKLDVIWDSTSHTTLQEPLIIGLFWGKWPIKIRHPMSLHFTSLYTNHSHVTGWRRPIGCLKLQVIFRKKATDYRALLRKMTYEDKASYDSTPPCIILMNKRLFESEIFMRATINSELDVTWLYLSNHSIWIIHILFFKKNIFVWKWDMYPHQKLLGGGFSTQCPSYVLICTIISNKTGHLD